MNIVFITPRLTFGGYEKVVVNYANAFSDLGHDVTVVCGFKEGAFVEQIQKNVKIVEFRARLREFVFPLTKYLRKNKVDILYAPFRSYTSVAVVARALSGNKDCVIYGSAHGYCRENRLLEIIQGKVMAKADVLTSITKELADFEADVLKLPPHKYRVFNNPVIDSTTPVKLEHHKWLGEEKTCPVIVLSGRLVKDKGKDVAIRIFGELIKETKAKMLVLGTGAELENLKVLAKEVHAQDHVDFVGFVDNPMGYISQCDVFLHPAEIEAFGNVIVEALFCNVPVVTTECKGPVGIICRDKYGITIGPWDAPDVVEKGKNAILDILNGKVKFTGLRKRALDFDAKYLEKKLYRALSANEE